MTVSVDSSFAIEAAPDAALPMLLITEVNPPPWLIPASPVPIAPNPPNTPPNFEKFGALPEEECFFGFGVCSAGTSTAAV
jgi:hypothetical protein